MKSNEISLNTEMIKQQINNFSASANILTIKTNELHANPSTSNANDQIPCYRSDNNDNNDQKTQPISSGYEYRPMRNLKRLRTQNSNNHLTERPSNNTNNNQNSQHQYPAKSFNTPSKQCRYQSNPVFSSSFSDQNYNSSSESSFCDESASDSKL